MSSSPDGIICYGLVFPDEHEFPWSEYGDIDSWWRDTRGYSHPQGSPYGTGCGEGHSNGWTIETIPEYYVHRRQWEEANPLPVEEVFCCSYEANAIVLAVPGTVLTSGSGEAMEFDPEDLGNIVDGPARVRFFQFIDQHSLAVNPRPCWLLTSFYG